MQLNSESLFLGIWILDKFLSKQEVERKNLQLVRCGFALMLSACLASTCVLWPTQVCCMQCKFACSTGLHPQHHKAVHRGMQSVLWDAHAAC